MPGLSLTYRGELGEETVSAKRLRVHSDGRVELYRDYQWREAEIGSVLFRDGLPLPPAAVSAPGCEVSVSYPNPSAAKGETAIDQDPSFLLKGYADASALENASGRLICKTGRFGWAVGMWLVPYLEFAAAPRLSLPPDGPRMRPSGISR